MTLVILNQDQSYISVDQIIKFGKAGATINADDKFLTLIKGKFSLKADAVADEEKKEEVVTPQKPINKMSKPELIKLANESGIDFSDEELEELTKAQIIELINSNNS